MKRKGFHKNKVLPFYEKKSWQRKALTIRKNTFLDVLSEMIIPDLDLEHQLERAEIESEICGTGVIHIKHEYEIPIKRRVKWKRNI